MREDKQQVTFYLFGSLIDFLSKAQQEGGLSYSFIGKPSVKDAIEAIGVPHVEVGCILIDGIYSPFEAPLEDNRKVEVYPVNYFTLPAREALLQPALPNPIQFVLDVHLGKLARLLRLLGFDSLYDTSFNDKLLIQLSNEDQRVLVTRSVGLLKYKAVQWGYWVRSQDPFVQLKEVIARFNLHGPYVAFSRCMECNHLLKAVEKEDVICQLPPKTKELFHEFYQCLGCRKVYWKGSHYDKMEAFVNEIFKE